MLTSFDFHARRGTDEENNVSSEQSVRYGSDLKEITRLLCVMVVSYMHLFLDAYR
jgi:hypothetical protein